MRARWPVAIVLAAMPGCNALTGVNDLEPVDCIECDASVSFDSEITDGGPLTRDASEAAVDTASDGTPEAEPNPNDAADAAGQPCKPTDSCDDGDECTADDCPLLTGSCRNRLVDVDGDGEAPVALAACGLDCNDDNKNVFSKQSAYFSTSYPTSSGPSFDYNCDGVAEREHTTTFKCTYVGGSCVATPGWDGAPPACGITGEYVSSCTKVFSTSCFPDLVDRVQRCR